MKRQTICVLTLGFFLGLGTVACTERNPAFHKPADGSVGPSPDMALDKPVTADRPPADTPVPPKDAEPRVDTPLVLREVGLDSPRMVDSKGEVGSELADGQAPDGRADAGPGVDTKPTKDAGLDTWKSDGPTSPPSDLPPANPDTDHPDTPVLTPDTADAPLEIDGPEADTSEVGDVLPDADEPDAWPDVENAEPDSEPLTDL